MLRYISYKPVYEIVCIGKKRKKSVGIKNKRPGNNGILFVFRFACQRFIWHMRSTKMSKCLEKLKGKDR